MNRTEVATRWPARAWVAGTWGYAVATLAPQVARDHGGHVWVYRATLDGEQVWVVALDPKRVRR